MSPFRYNRILVPTDLSPFAERAVRYAHGLAEVCKAELHVLHILEDEADRLRLPAGVVDPAAGDDAGILARLLGEPGGVRRTEVVWVRPDVPAAINEYTRDPGVDLIVMSSHGRTGLNDLLFGSVAQQVLHTAPCPVLMIRARDDR